MKDKKMPKCGNKDCGISTSIDEVTLTFGSGELYSNGFWEHPCKVCEKDYIMSNEKDISLTGGRIPTPEENEAYRLINEGRKDALETLKVRVNRIMKVSVWDDARKLDKVVEAIDDEIKFIVGK